MERQHLWLLFTVISFTGLLMLYPRRGQKKKVILLYDNARLHVAKLTRNTLEELRWEVLPHPAYSPDLAPSDYHLFRSLQTGLEEKEFENSEEVKKYLQSFFDQKSSAFYERGIRALPERWTHVIDCSGDYP